MNISQEFTRNDLIEAPKPHSLATGKLIIVFNVKQSDKTAKLNSGNRFIYENETYEIMNREPIDSPKNYVKFNCVRKAVVLSQISQ